MLAISTDAEVPVSTWTAECGVARVLLADDDLASRLALKTILKTAGYVVDGAATASEAIARLEDQEYQLVLADLNSDSQDASANLLAYARQKEYQPATALISSKISTLGTSGESEAAPESVVRITDENISHLLETVADLIGNRADRRIQRSLRQLATHL